MAEQPARAVLVSTADSMLGFQSQLASATEGDHRLAPCPAAAAALLYSIQ